jgi:hypothetical protein
MRLGQDCHCAEPLQIASECALVSRRALTRRAKVSLSEQEAGRRHYGRGDDSKTLTERKQSLLKTKGAQRGLDMCYFEGVSALRDLKHF